MSGDMVCPEVGDVITSIDGQSLSASSCSEWRCATDAENSFVRRIVGESHGKCFSDPCPCYNTDKPMIQMTGVSYTHGRCMPCKSVRGSPTEHLPLQRYVSETRLIATHASWHDLYLNDCSCRLSCVRIQGNVRMTLILHVLFNLRREGLGGGGVLRSKNSKHQQLFPDHSMQMHNMAPCFQQECRHGEAAKPSSCKMTLKVLVLFNQWVCIPLLTEVCNRQRILKGT